jgi:hypothetical protein
MGLHIKAANETMPAKWWQHSTREQKTGRGRTWQSAYSADFMAHIVPGVATDAWVGEKQYEE